MSTLTRRTAEKQPSLPDRGAIASAIGHHGEPADALDRAIEKLALAYGLTETTTFGISAGLIKPSPSGLLASMAQPVSDSDTPPTPESRWRRDRGRSSIVGPTAGVPFGLALGFQNGRAHGPLAGIATLGFGAIIGIGSMIAVSGVWRTALAFARLNARGQFPLRRMRFLNDARDRRVLRTVGPRAQFRHDRLHTALADTYPTSLFRSGDGNHPLL